MKYEKPIVELIELYMTDIVCDSYETGLEDENENDSGIDKWN